MVDRLWKRAERDLLLEVGGGEVDSFVSEHACRVARLAGMIAGLPEVGGGVLDLPALEVAALYHDMGWVLQVRTGQLGVHHVLLKPTSDVQFELAADWILDRLAGDVPPGSLEQAARAIRFLNNRRTEIVESQVLADADNLDQIGPQAVCLMIRKQQAEGRTLAEIVSSWRRQEEYHYWQARIKECCRFPSVRAVAQRRWQALRRFMNDLREVIELEDMVGACQAGALECGEPDRPV